MLIIEGPDGSGKSSLVRRLQSDLKLPISPRVVGSDTQATVNLAQWTEENVSRGFQRMIFDRHRLISEPIYGPILRDHQDPSFLDPGWMLDMTWRFYDAHPIIIYCLPPLNTVRGNVDNPHTDNGAVAGVTDALYASYTSRAMIDISAGVARLYNYETTLYSDVLRWTRFRLEVPHGRVGSRVITSAGR